MFTPKTGLVWIGILLLSSMFLIGQGGWGPQTCSIPYQCDDSNPCTYDDCVDSICVYTDIPGYCDDLDPCTEDDTCTGGVCSGTPIPGC